VLYKYSTYIDIKKLKKGDTVSCMSAGDYTSIVPGVGDIEKIEKGVRIRGMVMFEKDFQRNHYMIIQNNKYAFNTLDLYILPYRMLLTEKNI
jgi:hypothetical protein